MGKETTELQRETKVVNYLHMWFELTKIIMRPNQGEVRQKCQDAYMDEQGAPGQTQAEKGGLQRMETRIGSLAGIQRNRSSSQGAS